MNVFQNKVTRTLIAIFVVAMWALPFSLIKVGMAEFGVSTGDVASQTLYAGVRFLTAGIAVLIGCAIAKRDFRISDGAKGIGWVVLFGLVNIGLHYFFFYKGVAVNSGGRSAIIYSCNTFILIALSSLIFPDDKMSGRKALGCLIGFIGVSLVNIDLANPGQLLQGISLQSDGVLLLAALSGACGGMLTRVATRYADPFVATGYSLALGGGVLTIGGLAAHGTFAQITTWGLVVLGILIFVSAAAFVLYNRLLTCNPVSSIAIFNSCIPVLGLIFSCFILSEAFRPEYAIAALLSATGVVLVNTAAKAKQE